MSASATPSTAKDWLKALGRGGGLAARLGLVLPTVGGLMIIPQAWLLASILHDAIVEHRPVVALAGPIAALALLLALRAGLGFLAEVAASRGAEAVKHRLRTALAADIFARRPAWTASRSSGALASLAIEQVEALDGYLSRYLPAMLQAAVLPLAFAAAVLPFDAMVALIFVVTAPLIPLFMALAGLGAEAASRAQADALSRLGGYFADRLRGLVTLRLFGREAAEIAAVGEASEALRRRTMSVMRIAFLSSAVLEFFAALGVAGVALYVGLTLLDLIALRASPLALSGGLFCLLMAPEVYQPLRVLAAHYHDRASARAAAATILAELGRLPLPVGQALPAVAAVTGRRPAGAAAISVSGLGMATPEGRELFEGASFIARPRGRVAVLGPSGIGKSSFLEALAGLRAFTGSIALDGRPLQTLDEPSLRDEIALLGQRPRLFAGTLADNIRMGRPDACHAAIRRAAGRAQVLAFADRLPLGLDTPIGENGAGLSGGEAQRLALARIYLRDPRLVLLDEPTAHLDPLTERLVLDGLLDFVRGRTLIVATHSSAVAARLDQVYRIAGGRILPALRPGSADELFLRGAA